MTLVGGSYQPLPTQKSPDGILVLVSTVLQLELRLLPEGLRFYDPVRNVYLFTHEESEQARLKAEQLAQVLAERLRSLGIDPDRL